MSNLDHAFDVTTNYDSYPEENFPSVSTISEKTFTVVEEILPEGLRRSHGIIVDDSRDNLLTEFGKNTLEDRYLLPGESYQDLFARVASAYGDDTQHSQRLYDYMSMLWFMPATPVLSNGGSKRGLPISCYLNSVDDSLEGIVNTWNENVWLASRGGGIGCVDADTEFLTPTGWKRIADYNEGDEVFTVEPKMMYGFFNTPEKYVVAPAGKMYHFKGYNLDMVVSDNHRNFAMMDGREPYKEITTDRLLENDRWKAARFKPAVWSRGGVGLPLSELELRFMVAVAADSTPNREDLGGVRFRFTRQRKIDRMRWMLNELGVDYIERMEGHVTAFIIYDKGIEKRPLNFYNYGNANIDQLNIICDELGHWDGSFDPRNDHLIFSTMKKDEADFAQYVIMSVTGKRAGLGFKTRDGEIVVRRTNDETALVKTVEPFVTTDGKQYCFQTKTTYWLARRDNKIFVTGNTYYGDVRGIGEPVGLNGKTSGIIPFIRVMDSLTLAISQGSLRRGSAAVYIDVHHPEIEEFLEIRKPSGDFNRKALNIHHGILITDEFMEAVRKGNSFNLVSPRDGSIRGSVDARSLFQKIVETRLATGEPYLVFSDTVNKAMPEFQKKAGLKVSTSNLCVAPETRILTREGYKTIKDIAGTYQEVWNGTRWSKAAVAMTGTQRRLITVKLSNGVELSVTPYHRFKIQTSYGKWSTNQKVVAAADLVPGDKLAKMKLPVVEFGYEWDCDEAYRNGFYTADGTDDKRSEKPRIYLYDKKKELVDAFAAMDPVRISYDESDGDRHTVYFDRSQLEYKYYVPHNADVKGRLSWLAGLLDGDGTVARNGENESLQIASVNKEFLHEVRLLLNTLGVDATLSHVRPAGNYNLPDGKGGVKEYPCKDVYRMCIASGDTQQLLEMGIPFKRLSVQKRTIQRDAQHFISVVDVYDEGRVDDTYCFNEPEFHMGVFEGIPTMNCSEITLPTGRDRHGHDRSAVCCLSSLNVETWDQWNTDTQFIEDVMRFLDNVLTDYIERAEDSMMRAKYSALRERSVGLGVMGFHTFLQERGISFESVMAKSWNMKFFSHIQNQVEAASEKLAEERGACPDAAEYGVMQRFACKMAIAPTASISIICGGTSAAIEPIPANVYTHKTLLGSVSVKNKNLEKVLEKYGKNIDSVWNSMLEHEGSVQHLDFLTDDEKKCYKTSFEIDQRWVIELAADRAPMIDQAQSINIFIPADIDKWDLLMLHFQAWERGIKSLYYLRSKSVLKAGFAGSVAADNTIDKPKVMIPPTDYEVCLACQ